MKIYQLGTENKVLGVYPIDDYYKNPKYDVMQKGSKKKYFNEPFAYELIDVDNKVYTDEGIYRFSNISTVGAAIYIDESVNKKMGHLFNEEIELFESVEDPKKYYYMNFKEGLEKSWNYESTDVKWFASSEKPKVLKFLGSPQFYYEIVKDKHIFKINEQFSRIFVSDEFKRIYEENNFRGIDFKLVWDSEGVPEDFEINPVAPREEG